MRDHIGDDSMTTQFIRADLEQLGANPRTRQTLESLPDSRDTIITSVNDLIDDTNAIEGEPLLLFDDPTDPILTNTRKLVGGANVSADIGPTEVDLDLTDSGVTPSTYGAADRLVVLSIDQKGRVTGAAEIVLNSDNVHEGTTNLFFTQARARASISGSDGVDYNSGTGAISMTHIPGVAGTYASPTSITVNNKGQITAIS